MKSIARIVTVFLVASFAFAVQGAFAADPEDFRYDTTEDLYAVCSTPTDAAEYIPAVLACRAFIEAAVEYHDQVAGRGAMKRLVCYEKTVTIEDARQAFLDWGAKNRQSKQFKKEQPVVGLMRSLTIAYPCK